MNEIDTLFRLIDLGFEIGVPKEKATKRRVSKRLRELSSRITFAPKESTNETNKKLF